MSEDDIRALAAYLEAHVDAEVRFDDGARALYSTDASNYRWPPLGVVVPRSQRALIDTVAACRRFYAPIVHRGGGTSLTGASCNKAVVIDTSKYLRRVVAVNPRERWARVEPGVVLDQLRAATLPHGLTFGPDPATHDHCTLGGMMGNNSCGMHAQMAGRVEDNVQELDILTYDGLRLRVGPTAPAELDAIIAAGGRRGDIYRRLRDLRDRYEQQIRTGFPRIPRRISGYSLDELLPENGFDLARALIGTESTCVTILEAKLRLVYQPKHKALLVIGYPDIFSAGDHVTELVAFGPIGLEGMDKKLVALVKYGGGEQATTLHLLPSGNAYLMVEFGGESPEEVHAKASRAVNAMLAHGHPEDAIKLIDDESEQRALWKVRESGLGVTAYVPGEADTFPGWEDAAVPPERIGDYLRDFRKLLAKFGRDCVLYGHFGQGCVHCSIDFDLKTAPGIANFRGFVEEAADLVVSYGGSISGEHGDAQSRAELLPKMYGPELMRAMSEFKAIWDPYDKMNPGRLIRPAKLDSHLRFGAHYDPPAVKTHFHYAVDGTFAHATARCAGIGECRRLSGGYMCPSYMVTKEEKHSTRGRARLLFEMLKGDVITHGFRDENVKDALDLCLGCKGCKGDCPVQVDIATLKSEFLAHYYEGRLRPMAAYAMGFVHWWARIAAIAPELANLFASTGLAKRLAGIAPERSMPRFADETFRAWWARRPRRNAGKPQVMLWPDTFNDHFHPEVAKAAVAVLEEAGHEVIIPKKDVCCGRPLVHFGFLDLAKRLLQYDLGVLDDVLAKGIPIIGLEPSCIAMFRDELPELLPQSMQAKRMKQQAMLLSDFLTRKVEHYRVPKLDQSIVTQVHCHHHATFGPGTERKILNDMGKDHRVLDKGCCGMAGAFGFEKEKYDISMKVGEHGVLPAVREAPQDALIVADGFSCRTQIEQATDRRPVHLAEALEDALIAERRLPAKTPATFPGRARRKRQALVAGAAAAAVALGFFAAKRMPHHIT